MIFVLKIPTFWGFYAWLLIGVKDRKGSLIGESDVITLYCQTFQRLRDLFLSFNINQKPRIKSPKSGDFENKNYIGRSPDPFSSRSNAKEEKWSGYARLRITSHTAVEFYRLPRIA